MLRILGSVRYVKTLCFRPWSAWRYHHYHPHSTRTLFVCCVPVHPPAFPSTSCRYFNSSAAHWKNRAKSTVPDENKNVKKAKVDDSHSSDSSSSDSDSGSSDEEADPEIVAAAEEVAKSLPGDPHETKSDLLKKLQSHKLQGEAKTEKESDKLNLRSLVGSMKVKSAERGASGVDGARPRRGEKTGAFREHSRESFDVKRGSRETKDNFADFQFEETFYIREDASKKGIWQQERRFTGSEGRRHGDRQVRRPPIQDDVTDKLDMFGEKPLGIFTMKKSSVSSKESEPSLYDEIQQQLDAAEMTYPPRNGFEEMSRLTKEGKLWTFPINNEQGMDEEVKVGFHEHVFLDHLLKDFPKKGPVRHFMELVVTGLSKNAFFTAQQKRDHIEWYKDYFADKYAIIDKLTISSKAENVQQN